ncbi:hypothetical protein A2U01_0044746, partial [Trifolium medium]|nr:hypothetical protein [Trifolium medium]
MLSSKGGSRGGSSSSGFVAEKLPVCECQIHMDMVMYKAKTNENQGRL